MAIFRVWMHEDPSVSWVEDDISQLLIGLSIQDFDPHWLSQAEVLDIWGRQADVLGSWRTQNETSNIWVRQV
ncbi:MAG: hypothetical protein DDT19_02700 [Syntrophomonadaceae bacterium]|nr:hypothetical protein [Bacillota bacterium]